jgi:hypothetical protein
MEKMDNLLSATPPDKVLTFGKGHFHVWYPSPKVLRLAAFGHGEAGLAELVCQEMHEAGTRAGEPVAVFTDDRQLRSYDPAYRQTFERWLISCWDRVSSIHLLVDSTLVEMGMAVVSMKIGERGIYEMYRDLPDWYAKYQAALK